MSIVYRIYTQTKAAQGYIDTSEVIQTFVDEVLIHNSIFYYIFYIKEEIFRMDGSPITTQGPFYLTEKYGWLEVILKKVFNNKQEAIEAAQVWHEEIVELYKHE